MSTFVEVKTEDLFGGALDWAVAQITGVDFNPHYLSCGGYLPGSSVWSNWYVSNFNPSTNWSDCGPLIEKHRINVSPLRDGTWTASPLRPNAPTTWMNSESATVAICRAIVVDKIGMVVSVPRDLLP